MGILFVCNILQQFLRLFFVLVGDNIVAIIVAIVVDSINTKLVNVYNSIHTMCSSKTFLNKLKTTDDDDMTDHHWMLTTVVAFFLWLFAIGCNIDTTNNICYCYCCSCSSSSSCEP